MRLSSDKKKIKKQKWMWNEAKLDSAVKYRSQRERVIHQRLIQSVKESWTINEDEKLSDSCRVRTWSLAAGIYCTINYTSSACEGVGSSYSKLI